MTQADKKILKENSPYCAVMTREQFLFHEMRITARLQKEGLSDPEILDRVVQENLFQYPTERTSRRMAKTCLQRLSCLGQENLQLAVADAPVKEAKQVCLYAMMRQYYLVWEFMVKVVGEKYRSLDLSFGKKDVNAYFLQLRGQDAWVAAWSDSTIEKLRSVLLKLLVENEYMDSSRSQKLNPVIPCPILEEGIRKNYDEKSFPAFNYFE